MKYAVKIPADWASTGDWNFPIEENPQDNPLTDNGTKVCITALNPGIAELWGTEGNISAFVESLKRLFRKATA